MLNDKLNYSVNLSKRTPPCTKVPTTPDPERLLIEFKVSASKLNLLNEFERKVFTLFEIVSSKVRELNQRSSSIRHRSFDKQASRKNENKLTKSFNSQKTDFLTLDDLGSINKDCQKRVDLLEDNNLKEIKELEELKEKTNEGSIVSQLTEKKISEITRSIFSLYGEKDEKIEILKSIKEERKKIAQTSVFLKKAFKTLKREKSSLAKKRSSLDKKKKLIAENLASLQQQKIKVAKCKFHTESEQAKLGTSKDVLTELTRKNETVINSIKKLIFSIENLAEKNQVQEQLLFLRKKKIEQDSSRISKNSTEIFDLLRALDKKRQEIEFEVLEYEKRQLEVSQKFSEFKETQERDDRLQKIKDRIKRLQES